MDAHPRYTLVGFVLVILLSALVFWFTWLWRGDGQEKLSLYAIYFRAQSLSGLQVDSIVTMRGIKVGSVKSIAIEPQDIERVRESVALYGATPVRVDTRAVIVRNLLTGLASIDLVGSTQSAAALGIGLGDHLPVIKEGQAGLEQVQKSIPEMMEKVSNSLDRVALLLSEENVKRANTILRNLEKTSEAMSGIGGLFSQAGDALTKTSALLGEAKGQVGQTLEELSTTLKELRSALVGVGAEIRTLVRSATATSDKLREPRSSILGLPSGQLGPGEDEVKPR